MGSASPRYYEHPAFAKSFALPGRSELCSQWPLCFLGYFLFACYLVFGSCFSLYPSIPFRSVLAPVCLAPSSRSLPHRYAVLSIVYTARPARHTLKLNDYKSFDWSLTFSVVWATSFCWLYLTTNRAKKNDIFSVAIISLYGRYSKKQHKNHM